MNPHVFIHPQQNVIVEQKKEYLLAQTRALLFQNNTTER